MTRLTATIRNRDSLSGAEVGEMYQLFSGYYGGTPAALFGADLAEKTHVIVLRSEARLCGFSTLSVIEADQPGGKLPAPCRALFSGDTIIHHDYWGEQALALAFCNFAGRVKAQQPRVPLYWFLISKGYRTYRYLHLFSKVYWPSFRHAAVPELQHVLDNLAHRKFGNFYDPVAGLVRFPQSRGHLRADWAHVRDNMLGRPEINFFLQRNPRYADGEELACITALREDNLRSIARRAFVAGQLCAADSSSPLVQTDAA